VDELGEVAKRLTIKQGKSSTRQGFKFAMHAAQWTMIQLNPIVFAQSAGSGSTRAADARSTTRRDEGHDIRASLARQFGAETPPTPSRRFPPADGLAEGALRHVQLSPHPACGIKSQNR